MKWIKNKHYPHPILVPCGHCPACQQEKANQRTSRVRNESKVGFISLFITLTYDDYSVPFVYRRDLLDNPKILHIYRNGNIRFVRSSSSYEQCKKRTVSLHCIDELFVDEQYWKNFDIHQFKPLCVDFKNKVYDYDRIGVCYYKDIQNFYKRLRINLKRKYHYDKSFSFYSCSELGTQSARPHFHGLLNIPYEDEQLFRAAIDEAWPFDSGLLPRKCETARKCSSYVASYVNRGDDFPKLFTHNALRPKHSYSQGYGMACKSFSLDEVLKKIDSGDLRYTIPVTKQGKPDTANIPLPKYVINRYFPRFKGFGNLTTVEARCVLERPNEIARFVTRLGLDSDDIHKFVVRIRNSVLRFVDKLGISFYEGVRKYSDYYVRAWKAYSQTILKHFYQDVIRQPVMLMYDNLQDMLHGTKAPTLMPIMCSINPTTALLNPNVNPLRVSKTNELIDLFYKKLKHRDVNNAVAQCNGYNV